MFSHFCFTLCHFACGRHGCAAMVFPICIFVSIIFTRFSLSFLLLVFACRAGVATLTLNRPRARNALSLGVLQRLRCVLAHFAALPVEDMRADAVDGKADGHSTMNGDAAMCAVPKIMIKSGSTESDGAGHSQQQPMMNETAAQFLARTLGAAESASASTSAIAAAHRGVRPRVIVLRGNGPVFSSGHDLKVCALCSSVCVCVCACVHSVLMETV